jgi:hypothetical protein
MLDRPGMTARFASAWMAALLSAAACASVSGPHVIHVRDLPERPVYSAAWMTTDRAAAAVAMAVMHRELRLPRLDVTMYFLPDRDALRPSQGRIVPGYVNQVESEAGAKPRS